ncbi:MAG: hypothetical protein RLZZ436_4068 [Planctomycetota bacterium]|jgi:hypothetical protein
MMPDTCGVRSAAILLLAIAVQAAGLKADDVAANGSGDTESVPDFTTQVLPVLTAVGCNSGACHGAAAGRGGLRLSLFAGDPESDYEELVHAFEGRRVNLVTPELSLLLRKPAAELEHGGGEILPRDSPGFKRLAAWIRAGAPRGQSRRLRNLQVEPVAELRSSLPADVPLRVRASFDDGREEDVTAWTRFTPADPTAVVVGDDQVAHISRRGRHLLLARFADRVVPVHLSVPLADQPVDLSAAPRLDPIDEIVLETLEQLHLPASPQADDLSWLRRVTLDLTGRLPATAEVQLLEGSTDRHRREVIVDRLLSSEAFNDHWTRLIARWLQLRSVTGEPEVLPTAVAWLRQQIVEDRGLHEVARDILTASGDSHVAGPAAVNRMARDARQQAEISAGFLAGIQLGCANCHNHPLDRWTQDDYHGLAAVFAPLERSRMVQFTGRGSVTHPKTGTDAVPRVPGGPDLSGGNDHREHVFDWALDDQQRPLATATVNRLWEALFGRGLAHPANDLRSTSPPSHPTVLRVLTDDFVVHGYRIRHTLRRLVLSGTYGRSSEVLAGNAVDDRYLSRAHPRRLAPEVLLAAIEELTGVPEMPDASPEELLISRIDPAAPSSALDALGRCRSFDGCDEPTAAAGLSARLHQINGALLNARLQHPQSRLTFQLQRGDSTRQMVEDWILRAWSSPLSEAEIDAWVQRIDGGGSGELIAPAERRQRLEDFVWSLLNSREFLEND